jgi:hypothetical protein
VHALTADDESIAEGGDGFAEGLGVGREVSCIAYLSGVVEDDHKEGSGVQIDAGIESDVSGRSKVTHEDLGRSG